MIRKMLLAGFVILLILTASFVGLQIYMERSSESVSASTKVSQLPLSDVDSIQPAFVVTNSPILSEMELTASPSATPSEVPHEAPIETITKVPTEVAEHTTNAVQMSAPTKAVISIPVLNYHSIGKQPGNSLILDPDKFAQQMDYLEEHQFTPLSLSEFILILEQKKAAPPKPVLLTFDDGYTDNYELAMPILKKHGYPATLFMSPGAVGQEGYLNWEQVKEMHEAGWDIQPHGMTHPHLPQLSAAKQKEEIVEARKQIEQQLGTIADVFCYPYGEFNKHTIAILKEEGFRYAFTIQQGMTNSTQQPFQLKRLYVNGKEGLHTWSKKLN
jgi:peptidoglycan/xylan/chitin deacetylase (PgdA/CDA1 family)